MGDKWKRLFSLKILLPPLRSFAMCILSEARSLTVFSCCCHPPCSHLDVWHPACPVFFLCLQSHRWQYFTILFFFSCVDISVIPFSSQPMPKAPTLSCGPQVPSAPSQYTTPTAVRPNLAPAFFCERSGAQFPLGEIWPRLLF